MSPSDIYLVLWGVGDEANGLTSPPNGTIIWTEIDIDHSRHDLTNYVIITWNFRDTLILRISGFFQNCKIKVLREKGVAKICCHEN